MNIDKIVERIMQLLENDYVFDIDSDEMLGLKSDIADILLEEENN